MDRAGRAGWQTLISYTHGVVAVAAVDAIGIGAALFILGVPLAASLAVLTFVSAFVPIIGATVAGAAAALVTLVTNGPRDAVIVLIVVIVVQQAEGNLLQPFIMRRAVRLHPVVTLLAVTAGTLVAGIAGALIAVPACAVAYHAVLGYRANDDEAAAGTADSRPPDDSRPVRERAPPRTTVPEVAWPLPAGGTGTTMLLQNAADLWRILVVGVLTYPALIAVLRLSGKRTLAKMNAFDLIVTVALGSTLATILLSRDVALLEGLTALVLLVALQLIASWLSVRWARSAACSSPSPHCCCATGSSSPTP